MRKGKQSGFTTLELMVVLAVIAIIAAIAVPAVFSWRPMYNLKNAVREFSSNMQLGKMTAIRENANCQITFTTNPDTYTLQIPPPPAAAVFTKTVSLRQDYSNHVQFNGPAGQTFNPAGPYTFNTRGLCNIGDVHFSDTDNTTFYRIRFRPSGGLRTERWSNGQWHAN